MSTDEPEVVSEGQPDPVLESKAETPPADPPEAARSPRRAVQALASTLGVALALVVGVGIGRLTVGGANTGDDVPAEAAEVWTCSMHPQIRMPAPGQCPICGMELILASGEATPRDVPASRVTLSAAAQALAEIETSVVRRTEPRSEVRLLGRVDYDENRLRMVTSWTDGRIDRLKVRVTGTKVRKGQVVALLYSPEVYAAMRDLVVAAKQSEKLAAGMYGSGDLAAAAVSASRERLRLLGVSEDEIASIEDTRDAPKQVPVRSTFSGTILDRNVEEGDYVKAGTPLYHIADLSRVWVQIDAYESDLPHLALDQSVVLEVESLPGELFTGKVGFIDPIIDRKTRTARVRVEVDNVDGQLRPGMFVQAVVDADIGDRLSYLVIPASAALFTGRRSVVYVAAAGERGIYDLREVKLGPRAGPVFPVIAGLSEGERVVSRGAFVIDADLQLAGGRSMMMLADDNDAGDAGRAPVAAETLAQFEPLVSAYLESQVDLSGDDFDSARIRLEALATATNELELVGTRSERDRWQAVASTLAGHSRHAATAESPGEVRSAFEQVSLQVLELLRAFGNPTDAAVRVAFCPMAFDNRGAQWVQAQPTVANPYYGPAMLRCGDFRATVLPGERLAPSADDFPSPAASVAPTHQH
jgi:Cu(I)/Ag(I) efflux system membrane fusion protein